MTIENKENFNIEDTGALLTGAKGRSRRLRVILLVIAIILVTATALIGVKKIGDKRYNDQIAIADKAFVEGDYVTAEAEYLKAVEMNKRKTKARESLAYTYAIQSKTEESTRIYEELFVDTKDEKYRTASEEVAEGGLPSDTYLLPAKGIWREVPLQSVPYKETLQYFIQGELTDNDDGSSILYDSSDLNTGSNLLVTLMTGHSCFEKSNEDIQANNIGEKSTANLGGWINEADPRKWTSQGNYFDAYGGVKRYDAERTDLYVKEIYNITDKDINNMLNSAERDKQIYKQDGNYYCIYGFSTDGMLRAVEINRAWTDGSRYCVQYDGGELSDDYESLDRSLPYRTLYALVQPKTIDDRHYWSIYYNGESVPEEIASTQAQIYDLALNEEYSQFDLSGDENPDKLLIDADVNSEGYINTMAVRVNGEEKYRIKQDPYRYMPLVKLIKLKSGKCMIYIHTSTLNGYYNSGSVIELGNRGMETLLETKELVDRYLKEHPDYRPYELLKTAEGEDLIFEVGANEAGSDDRPEEYRFRYENGALKEVVENKKVKEEPKTEPEPEPEQDWRKVLVEPSNTTDQGFHGYVDSPEGLNMRYGPGEEYDVIEVLPNNAQAEEVGWEDGGEWIYIHYNGKYGWVNAQYFMMQGGRAKPVIYLYPTHTMDVRVKLTIADGRLTRTIPADTNGEWSVRATPEGQLTNKASGERYEYIFWESTGKDEYDWSHGYVVAGYEAKDFLYHILPKMGLNKKETEDFIEYWLPRLQKNKCNLVTFQTDCYTNAAKLEVYPNPDSVLRVFMACRPIEKPVTIARPTIIPFNRKGFTVVEWGGTEVR